MQVVSKLREFEARHRNAYDIVMALLAIVIVISYVVQGRPDLSEHELSLLNQINQIIWGFFVIDYLVRLAMAEDKRYFIRHNIIDLVSIVPFDYAFQGLRAARLIRVLYMLRVFIYLNRLYKRLGMILTTNSFHHMLWFTFSTIFTGAIAISYIEDMDIGDALWWSFVTTTTVGYGDIAPQSGWGRLVAVVLMVVGIGFLSSLTGTIATFFISSGDKKQLSYTDETVQQIIQKLEEFDKLDMKDVRTIGAVLAALKEEQLNERNDNRGIS